MNDRLVIAAESPLGPDLGHIFARHTADMHAQTPPESIYMMDASELAAEDVQFFVLREAGEVLAMGAVKRLSGDLAEIKSMHVLAEARGRGLSRLMLQHLIRAARGLGVRNLSLETGREPIFLPAQRLYEQAGFRECGPFGSYTGDPNSLYMTLEF
ncbi:GNAT family N-acetyltransferase [Pseudogemmobacter faecipullorum]|uniref:GNAT family N-acetyltransferase n=1 Tax=Pseudogemmobacter faecipullorum TaxID=2755041 RepID=A0ABS8CJF5_9RHOB|nr:GNAT family N-acetyltransferase [Pseudogemmobacter faecipullorum]MCB5409538.1 GNAT family N-acetyltransferase [Pseudogemmobacter faecipullorum]